MPWSKIHLPLHASISIFLVRKNTACADADMLNFYRVETCNICCTFHKCVSLQELAGYTGGDVSFLKEDFEFQFNKQLLWDSVIFFKIL